MKLAFELNGAPVETEAEPDALLVDVIRGLGLTGTKEGCGVGVCGLCTVLVDDLPVSSCLYLAACARGSQVWTAEGLAREEPELVQAFVEHEGMQCGICTPGQVMAAAALVRGCPGASEAEIRDHQAGNLCRCTGYQTIVESVRACLASR
ncbi:MAG: 2Fe-2S iron-sulfur cluster binding domain-containing protein [Streptosporangiales bacterium]|nr:2Fe-2S iron-sulfur cluster binding domain-containing protein [Streptosporangiales bacterium]